MNEIWHDVSEPPDTARTVVLDLGGKESRGFYWRPEKRWYLEDGNKRTSSAVKPTRWRENRAARSAKTESAE